MDRTPEPPTLSVATMATVTFALFQPAPFAAGVAVATVVGGIVSAVASSTWSVNAAFASGKSPSEMVTVKVNVPAAVGVPVSEPAELRLRSGGRLPCVTAKLPAGEPALDVNM